jgi:ubiquitin carboxyl-terminal hydrolase 4/11/15
LSHNGDVARAYANLLHIIYDEGPHSFSPKQFKHTVGRYGPAFSGYGQQDSQEFVLFLLDGLQEDLNRIQKKPYIEKPDSTDDMVHDFAALKEFAFKCWDIYKARNDSVITDLFAGMYKSTLVCPACDKVSIIFDPFNNLTLQLPVENLWTKEVFYFPLHKPPVLLDIEIDKNASIKALKEHVARKMGTDPQRLVMAEVYKSKFYKLFDNTGTISDSNIGPSDDIGIFEVDSVPTNYNPDKPKKSFSMFSFSNTDTEEIPSIDSPRADRLLVPIFNRVSKPGNRYASRQSFGAPSFAVFTRDEARDYDTILRRVLEAVATLTTRDILDEADEVESAQDDNPDSDTVVMNEEDADSADSKIKTASVEGEDGLVDVSMRDDSELSKESAAKPIPRKLRELFEIKVVKSRNEVIPLGFSSLEENKDYPLLSSRLKKKLAGKSMKRKPARRIRETANSPVSSSEDELSAMPGAINKTVRRIGGESEESDTADIRPTSDSESGDGIYPGVDRMFTEKDSQDDVVESELQDAPLIRPGEGIVLDWNDDTHDALFGADPRDKDPLRGSPTWTNVEHFPDPELSKKRQLRQDRRKRGLSLDQCLDEFGREEILSENDAWYCPRCKEHRRASKKFELWKTPDILVIHLKRFSASRGFRDKIDDLVDFPIEGLDLTDRVAAPEEGESLMYDLFAVDNHYGGLGGGHYTAYAKNFLTGEWNEYNGMSKVPVVVLVLCVLTSPQMLMCPRQSTLKRSYRLLHIFFSTAADPTVLWVASFCETSPSRSVAERRTQIPRLTRVPHRRRGKAGASATPPALGRRAP